MISASISGYEVVSQLARATDRPKEALAAISAVVTSVIEGFHGRITPLEIENAISGLKRDLETEGGFPTNQMIERFKGAL